MWVIMDTATGHTLPARKTGRGGTWSEFCDDPPRLFKEKRHAKEALKWWLDGPLLNDSEGDYWRPKSSDAVSARRRAITTIEVIEIELRRV